MLDLPLPCLALQSLEGRWCSRLACVWGETLEGELQSLARVGGNPCPASIKVGFFIGVVEYLISAGLAGEPVYDCIEFFSGAATLTTALRDAGFVCSTYEIKDDVMKCDILGSEGMVHAIRLIIQACGGCNDFLNCSPDTILSNLSLR